MKATVGGISVDRSPEWQAIWDAVEELMAREGLSLEDLPLYDWVDGSYARVELALDKMVQAMVEGDPSAPASPQQAIELMVSDGFGDLYYLPNERWFEEALFDPPDVT